MIHVPNYVAEGIEQVRQQLVDLDAAVTAEPTQLEHFADDELNLQWHELMSDEEKYLDKLRQAQAALIDYQTEMNRRIFRRTLNACIATTDTLSE